MQSIEKGNFERGIQAIEDILLSFPREKQALLKRLGDRAKQELDRNISAGSAAFVDGGAKLRGWQRVYMGSRGGYSAIRAAGSAEGVASGPNSAGAITNYHENGFQPSKGGSGRRLNGQFFYRAASNKMERVAADEAEEMMSSLLEDIKAI